MTGRAVVAGFHDEEWIVFVRSHRRRLIQSGLYSCVRFINPSSGPDERWRVIRYGEQLTLPESRSVRIESDRDNSETGEIGREWPRIYTVLDSTSYNVHDTIIRTYSDVSPSNSLGLRPIPHRTRCRCTHDSRPVGSKNNRRKVSPLSHMSDRTYRMTVRNILSISERSRSILSYTIVFENRRNRQ